MARVKNENRNIFNNSAESVRSIHTAYTEKCFRQKLYRKSKHIFHNRASKIVPFMGQCGKILQSRTGER
jgi:hypothetical protein